jgi:hypothetical protein
MRNAKLSNSNVSQTGARGTDGRAVPSPGCGWQQGYPTGDRQHPRCPSSGPSQHCNNDAHLRSFKDGVYKSREGGRSLDLSRTRDPEALRTVILQAFVLIDPIVARI